MFDNTTEKYLKDLLKAVDVVSKKFDKYEQKPRKKKKLSKTWERM